MELSTREKGKRKKETESMVCISSSRDGKAMRVGYDTMLRNPGN
jgi:hypothetical protein